MPEVIHDLNLRNVAGRVCYQIAQDQLLYRDPQSNATKATYVDRSSKINEGFHMLLPMIAGSTKIKKNDWLFPRTEDIKVELEGDGRDVGWLRLPFESLWVDASKKISLFFVDVDASGVTYADDPSCRMTSIVFVFTHDQDKSLRRSIGTSWFTTLSFVGSVWVRVNETGLQSGIYGMSWSGLEYDRHLMGNNPEMHQQAKNGIYSVFFETCFALNMLNNVSLVAVPPANKMPKSIRRYPKLEYHVLKIHSNRNGIISPSLKEQLRQSPRQHLRRGHLRRFSNPKFTKPYTWIPPCIVGDAGRGSIVKDYLL